MFQQKLQFDRVPLISSSTHVPKDVHFFQPLGTPFITSSVSLGTVHCLVCLPVAILIFRPPSLACLDLHSARSPSRSVSDVWVRLLPRAPRSQRKANDNDLRYLYMIYYALFCSVESGGTIATTPLPWQRGHGNRFSKLTVRAGRIAWTADAGGIARSGYCA